MSSIFGIIQFNQKPLVNETLQTMLQTLNHWDADDTGIWKNGFAGIGHLMLWNTPESLHEKMPLHSTISNCTITADARVDNRDELFEKLNIDYTLRESIPDSTLILKAYEKYGENCVKHLIGDFAFAIWDENKQQLFCARDQMGVKPFFYYKDENIFAFASEKKGILCLDNVSKEIDKQFLYNQMLVPFKQNIETTLYERIKRIKPACFLIINFWSNEISNKEYWTLDVDKSISLPSKEEYYEGLLYHFKEAVKCRIRSAYPIGAELSGGLDSSGVIGVAQELLKDINESIIAFANTIKDDEQNEKLLKRSVKTHIEDVIKFNDINNYVFIDKTYWNNPLEEADFFLEMNDGLERMELLWQLPSKRIAMERNVRTMLSGYAGDEMVTNMGADYALDFLERKEFLHYLFAPKMNGLKFNKIRPLVPSSLLYRWKLLKANFGYYNWSIRNASSFYDIPDLYKKSCNEIFINDNLKGERFKNYRQALKHRLLDPIVYQRLECETRHGIYFKIESRFPLSDIRLTQFYLSIPNELKYDGLYGRDAYRKAIKKYLPESIYKLKDKPGINAPFEYNWIRKCDEQIIALLQRLPENALIKKEAIPAKIDQLKNRDKTKELRPIDKLRLRIPSLIFLRWVENNFGKLNSLN